MAAKQQISELESSITSIIMAVIGVAIVAYEVKEFMPSKTIDQRIKDLTAKKDKQVQIDAAKKAIETNKAALKKLRGK